MSIKAKIVSFVFLMIAIAMGLLLSANLRYDFVTLNGDKHQHEQLIGNTLVINYFAQWCAPCLREIPELNEFHKQAPSNVKLFAISFDKLSHEELIKIKNKYNIEFPIIAAINNNFSFAKPEFLPATYIIKPNGELAQQLFGEQTVQSLNEAVSPH